MSNTNNGPTEKQQTLWCLPYDTETFFKQFLKISFTKFLKELVSNKYFPMYERQMAKQLYDRNLWGDKCWFLLQFFEFLNKSFEISELDMIINFIQEQSLRKIVGHFRLWIDLERLYLFNFLKLDRMQFMDDRIFMSLYRAMLFMHTLFSEYDYDDFHPEFIHKFCENSVLLIDDMYEYLSKSTKPLATAIKTILTNFSMKRGNLINHESLQSFKRDVKVKIVQLSQSIGDVQDRLYNNVKYQQKVNQQNKMKAILEMSFIDNLTKQIQLLVDPKKKIIEDYKSQVIESSLKQDPRQIEYRLNMYEQQLKKQQSKYTLYERLQKTKHDPYDDFNSKVYGGLISIDVSKKQQLQAKETKQIVSKNDDDQIKIYYQEDYITQAQKTKQNSAKVTYKDLAKNAMNNKNAHQKKGADEPNKLFNLRYTYNDGNSNRTPRPSNGKITDRDFDNNILFKNEIDQFLENSKIQMMQRLAANKCHTKTFLEIKNKLQQLFPQDFKYSFGTDTYSNKQPLFFSINQLKTLNRNKFDQMRKIINYMTAQKKIKNLILQKNIPENYPRNFQDIKTLSYNPLLAQQKVNFCNGKSIDRPQIL